MLSISKAKTGSGAMKYFGDHLGSDEKTEDYYTADEGVWSGAGAESLGLVGEVKKLDFARTLLALDKKEEPLLYHQNAEKERRSGWDLTFSAPKSVSVIFASGDEKVKKEVLKAHESAVQSALDYMQKSDCITSRRGAGGQTLENGKMIAAVFSHKTSREQDPQLHSHAFIMNLAERKDGTYGAIQSRSFFNKKMELGAFYRVALADELKKMDFEIKSDKRSFKIKHIPQKLVNFWSKRRAQIEESLKEKGLSSSKASELSSLSTRRKKEAVSDEILNKKWQAEALAHGLDSEKIAKIQALEKEESAMQDFSKLWLSLTQSQSTLSKTQLKAAVFESAQGKLSPAEAEDYFNELVRSPETVILTNENGAVRYTSREMFQIEKSIIEDCKKREAENHQLSEKALQTARREVSGLFDEQDKMLIHVTSKAGVSVVEGMAGTGKSYALKAAKVAFETDGKKVIGAALSGKAAAGLQESSGIKSGTIHSLLHALDEKKRSLDKKDVLVIDESGMVGSRQLKRILDYAEQAESKVILVGDSKQLQPIDAGAAFRSLSKELGASSLTDIKRQKNDWLKTAVTLFSAGEAGLALDILKEKDCLKSESTHEKTVDLLVDDFIAHTKNHKFSETLILTATKADAENINQKCIEKLGNQTADFIENSEKVFKVGERVLFTRNAKKIGVNNGDLGTIERLDKETGEIFIKNDNGKQIKIDSSYDFLAHGYAITTHKAQGATVDDTFILANEIVTGREWAYVATSRSREKSTVYADIDILDDLKVDMAKSQAKDFSQDYEL